jgi:hypothetical protein
VDLTVVFMGVVVIVVAALDIYLIRKKGKSKSFSAYIIKYIDYNRLAFFATILIGVVVGHVFWSMNTFDWADKEYLIERCKDYRQ